MVWDLVKSTAHPGHTCDPSLFGARGGAKNDETDGRQPQWSNPNNEEQFVDVRIKATMIETLWASLFSHVGRRENQPAKTRFTNTTRTLEDIKY